MAQPYVGEIRMFAGNFPPSGWMFCDGATLAISENETLFQLIGTTYGGDGESTFDLPDLRGRTPVHQGTDPGTGTNFILAETGGVESVTLTVQQMTTHNHAFLASTNNASTVNAQTNVLAQIPSYTPYITGFPANSPLNAASIGPDGGSQPHNNFQPYLCVDFIISLFGIFPSQT
jgi:microcystin-dependent protein